MDPELAEVCELQHALISREMSLCSKELNRMRGFQSISSVSIISFFKVYLRFLIQSDVAK